MHEVKARDANGTLIKHSLCAKGKQNLKISNTSITHKMKLKLK